MPETALTACPRAQAQIADNGDVLCPCGKKIGKIDDLELELKCRCGLLVYLPSEIMFDRNMSKALDLVHHMVTVMARRRDAA